LAAPPAAPAASAAAKAASGIGETISLQGARPPVAPPSLAPAGASSPAAAYEGFGNSMLTGMIAAASEEDGGERMQGYFGGVLTYAQQFFAVSSADVVKRLRLSMMPYPLQPISQTAVSDFRERPDFWGPFWIATTAVLFLAATGNFARMLQMPHSGRFQADYGLVSLAATMVYGCLVGVPMAARVVLYLAGEQTDAISVKQMICVYGYSLTPTIPVSVLCLLPMELLRWSAVLAGLAVSLAFIRGHLWTDLVIEAPSLKWKLISLFGGAQAIIFMVYKMHFFSSK